MSSYRPQDNGPINKVPVAESGAGLWANSGCKMGPAGLESAEESWSPGPFQIVDLDPGNQQGQPAAREPGDGSSSYS